MQEGLERFFEIVWKYWLREYPIVEARRGKAFYAVVN